MRTKIITEMLEGIEKAIACLDQNTDDRPVAGSSWSLHQHLEHLCLTGRSTPLLIQSALETSSGPDSSPISSTLFNLGRIPRGETQAPEFGLPKGMSIRKMRNGLLRLHTTLGDLCRDHLSVIEHPGRSLHPALGGLTPAEWISFVGIHFKHHLAIIQGNGD